MTKLTEKSIHNIYTVMGNVDVIVTHSYDNTFTGRLLVDEKGNAFSNLHIKGEYVFSSLENGPHWTLQPHFAPYNKMLNEDQMTWEQYCLLAEKIYKYYTVD